MAEDIYGKLLSLRDKTDLSLSPNYFLRPEWQLRYYQILGVLHLYMLRRFLIGDECGLGKSLMIIATYAYNLLKDSSAKMIVICPSSAMHQWAKEINKFTTGITSQVVEAGDLKTEKGTLTGFTSREYLFNKFVSENKNVLIFNYNTLCTDSDVLLKLSEKYKFMLVFDEATSFKNTKSNTWLYAKLLADISDRVYGLTATPIKNNLLEIYAIYKVILPNLFGSEIRFKKDYCIMEKKQLWKGKGVKGKVVYAIKGYKNLDYFKKVTQPYYLGRKKSDVAKDLPEIIAKEIYIKMDPEQKEIYDDVLAGFMDLSKFNFKDINNTLKADDVEVEDELSGNEDLKRIDKLTALIYLQQIANSPATLGFDVDSNKEKELLRLLEHELAGQKVVIYTRFKRLINRLEEMIVTKLNVPVLKVTGDVKNVDRQASMDLFTNSPDHNIILINSAAKESVNLQASGTLIFVDLPFSYGDFLQIIGRIHRIGTKHSVALLIFLMSEGSIDSKVYSILSSKKKIFDIILGDSAKGAIKTEDQLDAINYLFDELKQDALILKR